MKLKSACVFCPISLHWSGLAPVDVNRKSPIKAGRRLSQTLELNTRKWDDDEENRQDCLVCAVQPVGNTKQNPTWKRREQKVLWTLTNWAFSLSWYERKNRQLCLGIVLGKLNNWTDPGKTMGLFCKKYWLSMSFLVHHPVMSTNLWWNHVEMLGAVWERQEETGRQEYRLSVNSALHLSSKAWRDLQAKQGNWEVLHTSMFSFLSSQVCLSLT